MAMITRGRGIGVRGGVVRIHYIYTPRGGGRVPGHAQGVASIARGFALPRVSP